MPAKKKVKLLMTLVSVYPKKNTPQEKEYLAAALLNLIERSNRPMPPQPPEWEEGRELIEITEEHYSDGTKIEIGRQETRYSKPENSSRRAKA